MEVKKEEKIRKKKKVIVDALKSRLQRDVYSKITVQDIADEAGFSKGGVLHYFSTKEDIYLELIDDIFDELEVRHRSIMEWNLQSESMAPMASLVGIENFLLNTSNMRIIINLILYAFEEDKIMQLIRDYISKQRYFYYNIIPQSKKESRRKSDIDSQYLSRIAQTVVLFVGLMEFIDPVNIDHVEMVKFITTLLKG